NSGDRVAYVGFNHSRFLIALFATARLGAIFVPLNFRCTGNELAYFIQDSGAEMLIADEAHLDPVDEVRESLGIRHYLRFGERSSGWESIDELLLQDHPHAGEAAVHPDSPGVIL